MNLDEYRNLFETIPRPSPRQTEHFIEFVSNEHSWYKHLANDRVEPFVFYLDPNAGRVLLEKGRRVDLNENDRFIFREENADHYQLAYGTWQYFTTKYTVNFIPNSDGSIRDSRPFVNLRVLDSNGVAHELPVEVIEKGKFMMSRFLHKMAFENAHDYKDADGISFAEKHNQLIKELREHLEEVLDYIYDSGY